MLIQLKHNEVIDKVTNDIFKRKSYNTAIATIMEFYNSLAKAIDNQAISDKTAKKCMSTIAKLLYPITPHICYSILSVIEFDQALNPSWPDKIEDIDCDQEVQIIIQINGKLRSKVMAPKGSNEDVVMKIASNDKKTIEYLTNANVIKTIYIPNKLINYVIK